ncbi:hypothetical protein HAX54_038302 [Datura stramonium]|uniref:Uncharacterized protein n=1 Tax=Datura stramonium TaxID=4076 RepID=A0ABS8VMU0_DATST|nr:hypothetical protein [Datura stramonium]
MDGLFFPYAIPIAYDNRRFFSVTAALICFIFLGANCVPSIWDAFQFTGATATVSVGFIFLLLFVLRDTHELQTKRDRLVSWVAILLAVSLVLWQSAVTFTAFSILGLKLKRAQENWIFLAI